MATVGDQLIVPETGWKRIQNTDPLFTYIGESWQNRSDSLYSGGTAHTSYPNSVELNMQIKFRFKGSKLRIITQMNNAGPQNIEINIDGVTESYTEYTTNTGATGCQRIAYEKLDLQNVTHSVVITKLSTGYIQLDAIDIDETGEFLPYSDGKVLLKIIMNDSSEREYKVSQADVDKFIQWINGAGRTGDNCYKFSDIIDESMEYLIFEKIISFKMLELK